MPERIGLDTECSLLSGPLTGVAENIQAIGFAYAFDHNRYILLGRSNFDTHKVFTVIDESNDEISIPWLTIIVEKKKGLTTLSTLITRAKTLIIISMRIQR